MKTCLFLRIFIFILKNVKGETINQIQKNAKLFYLVITKSKRKFISRELVKS